MTQYWRDDKRFIGNDQCLICRGGGVVNDGISSYAYGHHATTSCAKPDADTGATVNDVDTWLYIPYDN